MSVELHSITSRKDYEYFWSGFDNSPLVCSWLSAEYRSGATSDNMLNSELQLTHSFFYSLLRARFHLLTLLGMWTTYSDMPLPSTTQISDLYLERIALSSIILELTLYIPRPELLVVDWYLIPRVKYPGFFAKFFITHAARIETVWLYF